MSYRRIEFTLDKGSLSNGLFIKTIAETMVERIPEFSIDHVTTDTANSYDATIAIEGLNNIQFRIFGSNNLSIYVGLDPTTTGKCITAYSPSLYSVFTAIFIISDNMYYTYFNCGTTSMGFINFGILSSKIDNSKVEVCFNRYMDSNSFKAVNNNNEWIDGSISIYNLGTFQNTTLPENTLALTEGIIYFFSGDLDKAPYGVNEHSVYCVSTNGTFNLSPGIVISNGTDYFYIIGTTTSGNYIALKL